MLLAHRADAASASARRQYRVSGPQKSGNRKAVKSIFTTWRSHDFTRRPSARLLVGVDQLAGGELGRTHDGLRVHAAELLDIAALDVVVLHHQEARLRPLALLAELHVAHDGLEGV